MQKHPAELKRAINRAPENDRGSRTYGKPLRKRITEATLAEFDKGRPLTRVNENEGSGSSLPRAEVKCERGDSPCVLEDSV